MENETMEKCLTNFAESVFEDINAEESCFFTRLINESEINEAQILPLCLNYMKAFVDQYKNENLQTRMKIFGYINLIDDAENKYVYYFQMEPLRRNMIIFRTINKRTHDELDRINGYYLRTTQSDNKISISDIIRYNKIHKNNELLDDQKLKN